MLTYATILQASLEAQAALKLQLNGVEWLKQEVKNNKSMRLQLQQHATLIAELRYSNDMRLHTLCLLLLHELCFHIDVV